MNTAFIRAFRCVPPLLLCAGGLLAAPAVEYSLEPVQPLSRFDAGQLALLEKLNHVDRSHFRVLKHLIVPDRWHLPTLAYSPMPAEAPQFHSHAKAIVVDLAGQVFGAYEHGRLVRWGPVSTGSEEHATPSGMYHLDWKSRLRVSSVDPTWIMPYYYNFSQLGLGMHEYVMVGRPASHGCVRLLKDDAMFIFDWGVPGTPVWLVGEYDFGQPKPWLDPAWWSEGVRLPEPSET